MDLLAIFPDSKLYIFMMCSHAYELHWVQCKRNRPCLMAIFFFNLEKRYKGSNFHRPPDLIFSKTVHQNKFRFIALWSVHQNPSVELSNTTFGICYRLFHHKGGPFCFRGVYSYQTWKNWSKNVSEKSFVTGKWVVEDLSSHVVLSETL